MVKVYIGYSSIVEHNLIRNCGGPGGALDVWYFTGRASQNIIEDNSTGYGGIYIVYSSGTVNGNIIRGNNNYSSSGGGAGIVVYGGSPQITKNVISFNSSNSGRGYGIYFCSGTSALFENNNLINNQRGIAVKYVYPTIVHNNIINNRQNSNHYELKVYESCDVNAQNNYWGTTDTDSIDAWIWDYYDDFDLGIVYYEPFETTPIVDAPGFLYQVEFNPPPPIGCEIDTFNLIFSKPMDISIQPYVTFGVCEPYTQHIIEGAWVDSTNWQGTYTFGIMTGDGINHLRVTTAKDCEGMEIPKDTRFSFVIDATGASSIDFIAQAGDEEVYLSWREPEMVDLMGYNMYRYQQLTDTTYSDTTLINYSMISDTTYTDTTVENGITYFYMFTAISTDFQESEYSDPVSAIPYVGIDNWDISSNSIYLYQNYPNPMKEETKIKYNLPHNVKSGELKIYNIKGQLVRELKINPEGFREKIDEVEWNGKDKKGNLLSNGIYLYRLEAETYKSKIKKMLILR